MPANPETNATPETPRSPRVETFLDKKVAVRTQDLSAAAQIYLREIVVGCPKAIDLLAATIFKAVEKPKRRRRGCRRAPTKALTSTGPVVRLGHPWVALRQQSSRPSILRVQPCFRTTPPPVPSDLIVNDLERGTVNKEERSVIKGRKGRSMTVQKS
ncbi:hypothetical protein ACHAPW_005752 [Verticillium nonalfalfae]